MSASSHLSSGELAAYLDRVAPASERERIETHLADCNECRGELVAVARVLRAQPRPRHWTLAAGGLAAAVVLLLAWPGNPEPVPDGPTLRSDGREAASSIEVLAPAAGALVGGARVTVVWRPAPGDAHYRVAVMDERGALRWSATTRDTTVTAPLPEGVTRLYWVVDALLPDGRSVTSGVRELRRAP